MTIDFFLLDMEFHAFCKNYLNTKANLLKLAIALLNLSISHWFLPQNKKQTDACSFGPAIILAITVP